MKYEELKALGRKLTSKYIKENIEYPLDMFGNSPIEKLYNVFFSGPHVCPVCGSPLKFISFAKGYQKFCSSKCSNNSEQTKSKAKQTCLEKYGVDNVAKSEQIKEKTRKTNQKRYGVDNAAKSKKSKSKAKQTCLEKYGVDNAAKSKKSKSKAKQTCLEKYGVENPSQSEKVKKKIKHTLKSKYNVTSPLQHSQFRSKAKQTCLEKYGVENPSQSPEIKQKIINSRRNHTLSTHPEIESSTGTEWVCTCPHQECDKCTEKTYVTHASIHYDRSRYGFELCTKLHPISDTKRSSLELKICDWLDEHRVDHETNNRTLIAPRELDIYIPSRELAIECNGVYWHSVNEKPKKYHMNKYNACKEIGVKLISIWEDEDINTMMNLIAYHLGFDYDECLLNQLDCNLVDYGLGKGEIIPHMMIRDGYECWDSGIFV